MARRLFIFDDPDSFEAGTLGEPGRRSFYLQARKGDAIVSVALEKTQVAVLADRLGQLLDGIEAAPVDPGSEARSTLDEPLVEAFRVGAMTLAWDQARGAVVLEAQPLAADAQYEEIGDDDPAGPDLLRVRLSDRQARTFVDRSLTLVGAGRPACPFCGMPLEPTGHFCARGSARLN